MIYVCLALVAALAVVTGCLTSLLRSQERAHARREALILDQLLHACGRAWTPAPADEWVAPKLADDEEGEWPKWSAAPEQEPVY